MTSTQSGAAEVHPGGFRTFLALWSTQSLSVLGSALSTFAFTVYLTQTVYPQEAQKPQLALALAVTTVVELLAAVLAAPLAGSNADRHDRRRIMLACDLLSGAVTLSIGLLMLGGASFWLLIPLVAAANLISVFHLSAFETVYALLVPRETLARANSMMQTTQSLARLATPAIAALLIGLPALLRRGGAGGGWLAGFGSGVPLTYLIDAATFLLTALVLTRLFLPKPPPVEGETGSGLPGTSPARRRLLDDVRAGVQYLLDRRSLLWLQTTFTVANFMIAPIMVFEPLIVKYRLAADSAARGLSFVAALALISTLYGAGALLSGLALSAWGGLKRRRVLGVLVPMIVGGLAMATFGLSQNLLLSGAAIFVLGLAQPVAGAHSQAIWQAQVPPGLQGRVFSVRRVIAQSAAPLAIVIGSALVASLPVSAIAGTLGLILTVFCAAQLLNPVMLRLDDREWIEAQAARRQAARGVQPDA